MRRLAATLLALTILPGFVLAQTPSGTHTVVEGETLWDLAQRYYQDPFEWPRIYEANRDRITDPHWIYPTQELVIPGLQAQVREMEVVTPAAEPEPEISERDRRSSFYRTGDRGGVVVGSTADYQVLSRDASWSAEWLDSGAGAPESIGTLVDFIADDRVRTAMPNQLVRVQLEEGRRASVGDALQMFRYVREIDAGWVARPTGVLSVTSVEAAGVEGVVLREYDRVQVGDLVAVAPSFTLQPGQYASDVSSDASATILGFGENHALHQLGAVVILDQGASDGVAIGDEYVLMGTTEGWSDEFSGRLRVVRVLGSTASARIVDVVNPVFRAGATVQLDKKMR
jgi:LysM repeat protein